MTSEETIATLNALIETCKDGEYGFRACAEHVELSALRQLFVGRADDCARAAQELQAQVVQLGGEPDTGGSAGAALHRGWVALRDTLAGYTDEALLGECARGEERATARYQAALEQPLSEAVRAIVERQANDVRLSRDQIRDLRERLSGDV